MPRSIPSHPAPLAFFLSLFASFSAPALAADPVEQQTMMIGSRVPTSVSELPGTVWVTEYEQLDQQTQVGVPLKEASGQLTPGLDIGSRSCINNGQNPCGRSVLVMIDGVSLNSPWGISRQFDSISPFNIECIEVISDASAVYGGGAIGGIINIVTKKGIGGDTRFGTKLGVCSGFQSREGHGLRAVQSISGDNDLFNGRLATAYQKNGAAYDDSDDQVLMDITQTDLQYNRSVDLTGSPGFIFTNGRGLDLGLQYYDSGYDGDRGLDLGRNFDALRGWAPYSIKGGVDLDREPESKRHQLNATYHAPEVLGHDLYLQAYYHNEKVAFDPFPTIRYSNGGAINYGTSHYSALQQDTDYYGMRLALVKTWEHASLTYGVGLDREKFTPDQMLFNLSLAAASGGPVASEKAKLGRYPDIDTDSRAFFFQGSWKATDGLTLSAGMRRQSTGTDVSDFVAVNQQILIVDSLGKTADAAPGESKDCDVNLVNVNVIYKLNPQQQVWANYSEGLKLLDPTKYYGFGRYDAADGSGHYPLLQGVSVNDSSLDGIKTKQVELGRRHIDGVLDTQVAAFYSWSDKSTKYDSKTLAVLQQDTKRCNYGPEGQVTYWLDNHWQVSLNGLATRSREKVDGRWLKQDVAPASPSKAGAFAGWKDDQCSLHLQGVHTFNPNDESGDKIDGYALFDLFGTQVLPVGTLTAGIQNLPDKDYTTVREQRARACYDGPAPAGLFDYKGRGRTYGLMYSMEFRSPSSTVPLSLQGQGSSWGRVPASPSSNRPTDLNDTVVVTGRGR